MLLSGTVLNALVGHWPRGLARGAVAGIWGLAVGVGLYYLVNFSLLALRRRNIYLGNVLTLLGGFLIGLGISASAAFIFGLSQSHPLMFDNSL